MQHNRTKSDSSKPDPTKPAEGRHTPYQPDRTGAPVSDPGESGTGRGAHIPPGRDEERVSDKETRH